MVDLTSGSNNSPYRHNLTPFPIKLCDLKPLGHETRKHSKKQIAKLAHSLREFGFVLPILVDDENRVVAGSGLIEAAKAMDLAEIPAVRIKGLSEVQLRSLRLALNRLAEDAEWDLEALSLEFREIIELEPEFELTLSGFETAEIDARLIDEEESEDDRLPPLDDTPERARRGDLWRLGKHRVFCGDSLDPASYLAVCQGEPAQMVFTDPPYNVKIANNVSGLGAVKHKDFAMASGEMSSNAFTCFLREVLSNLLSSAKDGAIFYVCMDWRHQKELLAAMEQVEGLEQINLCVWNKTNAGMGSLYRSKHELVYVLKAGTAPHFNNIELGRHGRNRSNVWDYPGVNGFSEERSTLLSLHPTVKPVAMIADAILDCSRRHGLILDPFGGSGSTLMAAEKTGRRAALIELEPRFVDVTLKRWEDLTGEKAILERRDEDGESVIANRPPLAPAGHEAFADENEYLT